MRQRLILLLACLVAGLTLSLASPPEQAYGGCVVETTGSYSEGANIRDDHCDTGGNKKETLGTCISGESACEGTNATAAASYIMVRGALPKETIVVAAETTNTTSATFTLPAGAKTPVVIATAAGAQGHVFTIYGAGDSTAANGISLCVITISVSTKDVKSCDSGLQITRDFPYYYYISTGASGSPSSRLAIYSGLVASGSSSGGAVTNAGTFAVQENGAALTALQLIDDDQTGGTACVLITTAATNATNCKGSAGRAMYIRAINTTATLAYLRLYNLASAPTCSSATGFVESIPIPASTSGAGFSESMAPFGQAFATGIGFCVTGGGSSTDNTNAGAAIYLKILYK